MEEKDQLGIPIAKITFNLYDNDKKLIEYGKNKTMEVMWAAGAREVVQEARYAHLVGAARMGDNPETSVVDQFGRAHDIANLFICDGSIMPTQGSANPGLTIMALAARAADYLIAEGEEIFKPGARNTRKPVFVETCLRRIRGVTACQGFELPANLRNAFALLRIPESSFHETLTSFIFRKTLRFRSLKVLWCCMKKVRKAKPVGVLTKTFKIIELIRASSSPLTLDEISSVTAINKSTALRFLAHLEAEQFLSRDMRGAYSPGQKLLQPWRKRAATPVYWMLHADLCGSFGRLPRKVLIWASSIAITLSI